MTPVACARRGAHVAVLTHGRWRRGTRPRSRTRTRTRTGAGAPRGADGRQRWRPAAGGAVQGGRVSAGRVRGLFRWRSGGGRPAGRGLALRGGGGGPAASAASARAGGRWWERGGGSSCCRLPAGPLCALLVLTERFEGFWSLRVFWRDYAPGDGRHWCVSNRVAARDEGVKPDKSKISPLLCQQVGIYFFSACAYSPRF